MIRSLRLKFIGGVFLFLACLVIIQILRIQGNPKAKEVFEDQQEAYNYEVRTVYPERGNIYDRWGNLLAGNTKVYEVGIALNELSGPTNYETIAKACESVLGLNYSDVLHLIEDGVEEGRQFLTLGQNFTPEQISQLEAMDEEYQNLPKPRRGQVNPSLQGMHWTAKLRRKYPENTLGSNILGFYYYGGDTEEEKGGILGVEQKYENLLAGTPKKVRLAIKPNEIDELPDVPAGASIILTIDREIQAMTEEVLDKAVEHNGANGGVIIILDPRSGEILAMAANPRLDPNNYSQYDEIFPAGSVLNPAVSETYEPGSVFKVITMAAALDSGAVKPETEFVDTGVYMVGGLPIYNWDRGAWGPQTMTGCMQHSLNVCLSWIADQVGPTRFYSYLKAFGIDHRTNVDIADERIWPLRLPGDEMWTQISLATNSFGQGLAVTPIQMITAISAVANDGKMMAPHVMKSYVLDGRQYDFDPVVLGNPISDDTARTLTEMLAVSLEEEASNALVEGYRVAGKTGTAEIANGAEGYSTNLTNASFVGWGPADDPQFIVYVWLKEPSSSPWGSVVAAPVFSEVVTRLVNYLDLPPDAIRQQLYSQ